MLSNRKGLASAAAVLVLFVLVGASFIPPSLASTGKWRNINPTEYTNIPNVQLNSVFMINGGTGGIGSGNGWAVGNNGSMFHWDGFSWNNQSVGSPCRFNSVNFGSPLSVPLNAFSSSAGFVVGGNNSITQCAGPRAFFWNGNSWFNASQGLVGNPGNLSSVFVYQEVGSSISAFAVGTNATAGTSYQFNGVPGVGAWNQISIQSGSTGCPLTSISMVSITEGWAVGFCGNVYHWSGGGWVNAFHFSGVDFYSVFMTSATDGWAVGSAAQIAHYTGGIWTCCVTPGGVVGAPTLRSVTFVSSSEGWAVGDSATIVHYSGGLWSGLSPNQIPTLRGLRGVHATGGSNVWAVGQTGSILLWDGSIWGSITAPLQTNYNSIFMTGGSDGAAVGNATAGASTIVRWDGVKWTRPQGTATTTDLWGVWELNSGEWWAVGGGPGHYPYILHMTSVTSSSFTGVSFGTGLCLTSNCVLRSVAGTGSNNVWAVGDGGLFAHWDGTVWGGASVTGPVPAGTMLRSITYVGNDPNNGWAVGYTTTGPSPLIFHKDAVNNWVQFSLPAGFPGTVRFNDVQFLDSSHGWIAADSGYILFFDGTKWTPSFTVGSYNMTSVFVTSTTDGWAAGQDTATGKPVFVHWDGTNWNTEATIPPFDKNNGRLQSMFLLSSTNGFAVGTTAGGRGYFTWHDVSP